MKYVSQHPNGTFDLTEYERYLEGEAGVLSQFVRGDDLLGIHRFSLGAQSFHDARLERFVVQSPVSSDSSGIGRIEIRLRGPYFDRYFELQYDQVLACSVEVPAPELDLLIHELRLENCVLVHELRFDQSKRIEIACRGLRFKEQLDG